MVSNTSSRVFFVLFSPLLFFFFLSFLSITLSVSFLFIHDRFLAVFYGNAFLVIMIIRRQDHSMNVVLSLKGRYNLLTGRGYDIVIFVASPSIDITSPEMLMMNHSFSIHSVKVVSMDNNNQQTTNMDSNNNNNIFHENTRINMESTK